MKNILLRAAGLALALGLIAMAHATISTHAAERGQEKTGIDRKAIEIQIDAFKNLNSSDKSRLERKEAEAFDVGSSMIWAAIFSISAIDDQQFASDASLELADLIDRLEGHPEEKRLREVLRMVVRGTGTAAQRLGLIYEAINMHRSELTGTQTWYYDAGVILPYITLWVNPVTQKLSSQT